MGSTVEAVAARCDVLIRHGQVITVDDDRTVHRDGAIAIAGGRIVAVGPDSELAARFSADEVIDARGGVVHPGFVDAHVHAMNTVRGAAPDTVSLAEGMNLNYRWWAAAQDDDEYASTLLVGAEMISNGTTCFIEAGTAHSPDAVADAMTDLGIRGLVGDPFLWDIGADSLDSRAPKSLDRALELLGGQLHRNNDPDALVRGAVAIFGYGASSGELMTAAREVAVRAGVVFTQHQSYGPDDAATDARHLATEPLARLAELDVLGPGTMLSHMNVLSPREQQIVASTGTAVVWCPSGALSWATGAAARGRHAEMFRAGATVALGSDGATSSCRYDISFQGLLALLTSRDRALDRERSRELRGEGAVDQTADRGRPA